jgi:hypothetical protein
MSDQPTRPPEVYCPRCRGGNPPNAQRCMWCDAPLANAQQFYSPPVAQADGQRKATGSRLWLALVGVAVVLIANIYDLPDKLKTTVSSTNSATLYSPCNLPACLAYPDREQRVSLSQDIPPHTVRKALAIFDVAKDASGLRLVLQGTMERDQLPIDLGR